MHVLVYGTGVRPETTESSTSTHAGNHLDHPVIVVETPDLLEIRLPLKQTHTASNQIEGGMSKTLLWGNYRDYIISYPFKREVLFPASTRCSAT